MTNAKSNTPAPAAIVDAVRDQHGQHWVKFGTLAICRWISLVDLQLREKEVFARLAGPGMTFLTTKKKNAFKQLVEGHVDYRDSLVAAHPGWLGRTHYVFGDGSVAALAGDLQGIIIAFEPLMKFRPSGTLKSWQQAIGPIVRRQPLPLFVLDYSNIGPLLRFIPGMHNPIIELVGDRELGKSTLLAMASSCHAGNKDSDAGGGETWNLTHNSLDPLRASYCDSLLPLDEANLAGTTEREQREMIKSAIFKLSGTSSKRRFTDAGVPPEVKAAVLSTSNVRLSQLLSSTGAREAAMASRVISVIISADSPHGVLRKVPDGFRDSGQAIEHLRAAVDEHYGTVGRAFVARLIVEVARDENGLCVRMAKLMSFFNRKLAAEGVILPSARIQKVLALTYAAGRLLRDWGILPKDWGSTKKACLEVARGLSPKAPRRKCMDVMTEYYEKAGKKIFPMAAVKRPLSKETFERSHGFLREVHGVRELLIPTQFARASIPNIAYIMKELASAGQAKTEGGKQGKLSVKVPKSICLTGRVYVIRLP